MSKSICVYLGARSGKGSAWAEAATTAGNAIAEAGHTLVYGGGQLGLMGTIADSALDAGGRVVGVIPKALVDLEQAHPRIDEQHIVENMHERKAKLTELSDAFLILPGGFGTLDELFEAITWRQLNFHQKPIAIWNVNGYYDALWDFLQNGKAIGFMPEATFESLYIDSDLDVLLGRLV
ncbi:MAG: TIGR00730 family Rossman fold protein [Phycisphaera sp.]|nr:MAG: TIGR00730 family Rossman fold protein [Phycisphaera sp.]